jgi:hypothetical protein
MSEELVMIRNRSNKERSAYVNVNGKDERFCCLPGRIEAFPRPVAEILLKMHQGALQAHHPQTITYDSGLGKTWIANGTGNPYLPETLTVQTADEKKIKEGIKWEEIVNPLRAPTSLSWEIRASESWVPIGEHGHETVFRPPPTVLNLYPYTRITVDKRIANWILGRDNNSPEFERGRIVLAKPKADFEPEQDWSIQDLALWCKISAPRQFTNDIVASIMTQGVLTNSPQATRQALKEIWPYVFHILVDPSIGLPTRQAFEEKKQEIEEQNQGKAKGKVK